MSILRRFLGIQKPNLDAEPHLAEQYRASSDQLMRIRQDYRQAIQNVDSGAKIMMTWDDALKLVTRGPHEQR